MIVSNIRLERSPENLETHTRLAADVFLEKHKDNRTYWFEVENDFIPFLNTSGDAWLCFAAPYAFLLGENLTLHGSVDPFLQINIRSLLDEWSVWFPRYTAPEILIINEGATSNEPTPETKRSIGSFFSGGIDSLFTLLRNNGMPARTDLGGFYNTEYLISVWGWDIRLNEVERFQQTQAYLQEASDRFGKKLIVIKTNIRSYDDAYEDNWGEIVHGSALASVGHALSNGLGAVLIGSTYAYGQLCHHGSHPLTDPLFSSARFRIVHDAANFNRVQKTKLVSESPEAMQVLRVCTKELKAHELNCSKCQKCLRTMLTLDLFEASTPIKAPTFYWENYKPSLFRHVFLRSQPLHAIVREIQVVAKERKRQDIVSATETSIRRSSIFKLLSTLEHFLRRNFPIIVRNRKKLVKIKNALYKTLGLTH